MSITFVYRDENNKVQVKKIEYEEVKKDLMKYLSHDIRSIIKEKEEDENTGMYWDGSRLISIYTKQDIHGVDIKTLEQYRVAYEHNI